MIERKKTTQLLKNKNRRTTHDQASHHKSHTQRRQQQKNDNNNVNSKTHIHTQRREKKIEPIEFEKQADSRINHASQD